MRHIFKLLAMLAFVLAVVLTIQSNNNSADINFEGQEVLAEDVDCTGGYPPAYFPGYTQLPEVWCYYPTGKKESLIRHCSSSPSTGCWADPCADPCYAIFP